MTPCAILLSAAAQLSGFIWWGKGLLHNERAMVIFFGGGYNNHPFTDYYTFDDGDWWHDGKGQNGDGRPDDGDGRHNDGKGQQGDGQHNDGDG